MVKISTDLGGRRLSEKAMELFQQQLNRYYGQLFLLDENCYGKRETEQLLNHIEYIKKQIQCLQIAG